MDLNKLFSITEKLQRQTIGEPAWLSEKKTFEYSNQTIEVVVVLKAIRATQSIQSMKVLCDHGLFIDMSALFRCINDCSSEIYFLLEKYPEKSQHVDQFIKAFFEANIDGKWEIVTEHVETRKIHNAMVRVISGLKEDEGTRKRNLNVYKIFSGYIHAHYGHIMQIYGGNPRSFNLGGVNSIQYKNDQMQIVETAYDTVLLTLGFVAQKFGLREISKEILELLEIEN